MLSYANGTIASVHMDYVRRPTRRFVEVVGEDGVLRWEFEANRLLRYAPVTREWITEEGDPRFARNDMFAAELCEFAARVRGDLEAGIGADARQGIECSRSHSPRGARPLKGGASTSMPEQGLLRPVRTLSTRGMGPGASVNLTGMVLCAQAAGERMLDQGGGVMVNISSTYGVVAPDQRLYEGVSSPYADVGFKPRSATP